MENLLCQLLQLYVLVVIARIILSWFPVSPGGGLATVFSLLYAVTEPVLGPLRRVLPSVGMLDLSPFVAMILLQFVGGIVVTMLRQASFAY